MKVNKSPWIHQLRHDREPKTLSGDVKTDIVIVGAGIAGVASAFFTLRNTDKHVVLIEKGKLAHGATGHNAGQVVSYFERPFTSIVEEFGLTRAIEGQSNIESAWGLLDLIYREANLDILFSRFKGHAGLSTFDQVLSHLEDNLLREKGGLNPEEFFIAESAPFLKDIPSQYVHLYSTAPQSDILEKLESIDPMYCAVFSFQKGCINSALFCQEVMKFLLEKYATRLSFYEHTNVSKFVLKETSVLMDAGTYTLEADKVVLCTNGFENMTILNHGGLDIDTSFHHNVKGIVGYMAGYVEKLSKPPMGISYVGDKPIDPNDPVSDAYFYATRRPYEFDGAPEANLISIGGPERSLDDKAEYTMDIDYPEQAQEKIDEFVRKTYGVGNDKKMEYEFSWHGLMGYTPNGIRLIGAEPKNNNLLYNLGCNGIGILPSLYGGERISKIIAGEVLPPSIFDPRTSL